MSKKLTAILLAIVLTFALSACTSTPAATNAPTTAPTAAPTQASQQTAQPAATQEIVEDEFKTITVAAGRSFWQGSTTNIYLHGSTNVWESLVMIDENMNPTMQLAESVTVSADGLTWTVKLKDGVKFHDGSLLDADTAIYNLDRLYHFNGTVKAYDPEYKKTGEYGDIVAMEKVDDLTFTVTHA